MSGEQDKITFFYNKNCGSGHENLKLKHEIKSKLIQSIKANNKTVIWKKHEVNAMDITCLSPAPSTRERNPLCIWNLPNPDYIS
jgi:hypothetical protein